MLAVGHESIRIFSRAAAELLSAPHRRPKVRGVSVAGSARSTRYTGGGAATQRDAKESGRRENISAREMRERRSR